MVAQSAVFMHAPNYVGSWHLQPLEWLALVLPKQSEVREGLELPSVSAKSHLFSMVCLSPKCLVTFELLVACACVLQSSFMPLGNLQPQVV